MPIPIAKDESSDYDSSSSSISRSWLSSTLSFSGSRRSSISEASSSSSYKPHKNNEAACEAMKWLHRAKQGRVSLEHFRLLRRLGSGDLGNVYLCQIRNPVVGLPQCFYAMKVVDREALAIRKKLQRADMEKEILGMLDHPFLPSLYAEFEASHYSCLVMEYCPGGDLYASRQRQSGRRFSVSSAKFYATEILLALEYLHMLGIVYRDLQPENVLVREDGHIMLTDFDLSLKCDVVPKLLRRPKPNSFDTPIDDNEDITTKCSTPSCVTMPLIMQPVLSCFSSKRKKNSTTTTTIIEHANGARKSVSGDSNNDYYEVETELIAEPINARSKSFVGTHEYLAPEVISGQGHGSAVDWWTLGVFLYEMLFGTTPFKGENNEKTLMNILKMPLTFPKIRANGATKEQLEDVLKAQELISKLLVKNPKKRIGNLKGSVEIKRHDFFKGVNWALIRSVRPPEVPNDIHHKVCKVRSRGHVLSKQERDAPYQIPQHFDYF